jgi:exopolysaccharide biosynthesis polyprenyl glycosylphosphotransferase
MEQLHRKILMAAFKIFDLLVMVGVFMLATSVVYSRINTITFHEFLQMRVKVENFIIFIGFILLWHLIFSLFGLYRSRRFSTIKVEIKDLLLSSALGTFTVFVLGKLFSIVIITPLFIAILFTGIASVMIISRLVLRYSLKKVRLHGRNLRHMLIAGTNDRARNFARKIESRPELGYSFVGFVDDQWKGNGDLEKYGWKIVSNLSDFNAYIRGNVVDEVVIGLPMKSLYHEASQIFAACEEQGIIVRNLTDIFNTKLSQSRAEIFEGNQIISHYTGAMQGWPITVKRAMDILLSGFLLLVLSPLFLLVGLLIKLDSPGPVFFSQDRVGLNKRRFRLYKFRTMIDGADKCQDELECLNEACGPVFKIRKDPRITKLGSLLRKTSIDELPQLINVLKSDMSLVGPRPLPVRDYNGFNKDWHRRRFSVRPGITCLWQVNGRSSIPFEKWMELDMNYIDKWSLWLDVKILTKTIPSVLKRSGAA